MMDLSDNSSTDLNFCSDQVSIIVEMNENNQQKKEDISHSVEQRFSLLNLNDRDFPLSDENSNTFLIDNYAVYDTETGQTLPIISVLPLDYTDDDDSEFFDDFDPNNALIFKKSPTDKEGSFEKIQIGMKRKHSDIDESLSFKSSQNHRSSTKLSKNDKDYLESMFVKKYCKAKKRSKPDMSQIDAWRQGPAKYWFDLLGVPESGDGFDYGFELADETDDEYDEDLFDDAEEDAFLMVSQVHWEDSIIWDLDDTSEELTKYKVTTTTKDPVLYEGCPKIIESPNGILFSNLPVENEELVYGLWETEIIWDAKAMRKILQPKILEFDPSDENIILASPEDVDPTPSCENDDDQLQANNTSSDKKYKESILIKTGVTDETQKLDPFNISNDIYYASKSADNLKSDFIHQKHMPHSIPVLQLQPLLIPTYMGSKRLRNFHRPALKRYTYGRLSEPLLHPVLSLTKYIIKKEKIRQEALEAGELFFMRSFQDLSGRDGNLVLVEFSEEHPPLMNFIGMCSNIKNYYKCEPGKDNGPPNYKFGETAYPQNDLFLGHLAPGESLQTLENNMYRAPIYEHKVNLTDFLIIRTRNQYYIREIDALYVAGQQCPLYEVPAPKSKKVVDFMKNFVQVFAYKAFSKSNSNPPKIHWDVLKKAFPTVKLSFIKRHLNFFADYKHQKEGLDSFHWVLKPSFRLPLEDEIRALISPEQCCAYFSMVAAQQRLKDAGYGDKSAFVLQEKDVNDEEIQNRLDDEVKAAPWNTTRAYIDTMNGKCCLQLIGPADPTGCGEGFSYVRVPLKSVFKQEDQELKPKKITGTEADLRYLSSKKAENILLSYGVPEQNIKKLTRWEMVDAVRTLSTIREDRGEEGFAKFSRSKKFTIAGCQQRYKEECQRIFDQQNHKLSSSEVLSTDDEDEYSNEVIEEMEKMAESIENMLTNTEKSDSQLEFEREEREREELLKMLFDTPVEEKPIEPKKDETFDPSAPRTLKIHRTFRNADGSEYSRTEIIHNAAVIDAYLRIRSTANTAFIKEYAYEDEEIEREKKKIESELKSLKEREKRKEKLSTKPTGRKVKCGSCGQYGHTKVSVLCPNSTKVKDKKNVKTNKELIKVDGTKLKFSMKLIKDAESTSAPEQTSSTKKVSQKKPKQSPGDKQVDSTKNVQKPLTNHPRTDPVSVLSTIFEEIITVIRGQKQFQPFLFPVNTKALPDYRRIISRPMDLQTIRDNIRQKKYQSRMDLLSDIVQIKDNSIRYYGQTNRLSDLSQKLLNMCVDLLAKKENKIIRLENAIKPLVDHNDHEAFSEMIGMVIKEIKSMPQAVPFLKPVNKNLLGSKTYYNIVKNPMDLETMTKKVATHKYRNRTEVMKDFQLIYNNCILYNGQSSAMKTKAETLLKTAQKSLDDLSHQILHLESSIASVQERAMRQADIDTSWMYEDDCTEVESKFDDKSSPNHSKNKFDESSMNTNCKENTAKTRFDAVAHTLNLSEDDSEDSSSDMNYGKNVQSTTLPTIHATSVLEQDLQFSSDDDL